MTRGFTLIELLVVIAIIAILAAIISSLCASPRERTQEQLPLQLQAARSLPGLGPGLRRNAAQSAQLRYPIELRALTSVIHPT